MIRLGGSNCGVGKVRVGEFVSRVSQDLCLAKWHVIGFRRGIFSLWLHLSLTDL